jgi:hypothetical protein
MKFIKNAILHGVEVTIFDADDNPEIVPGALPSFIMLPPQKVEHRAFGTVVTYPGKRRLVFALPGWTDDIILKREIEMGWKS